MGSKYRAKFTDDPGNYTWIVDIIDTQYESYTNRVEADGGTFLNIECLPDALLELVEYRKLVTGPNGFDLIYGNRGDDAFKGVKGSRVNLTFIAEDSTDLTFLHAVAQTQEDRYFIQIQRNGSLFWQGVVLQDLMRIPYNAFPFAVEFQARTIGDHRDSFVVSGPVAPGASRGWKGCLEIALDGGIGRMIAHDYRIGDATVATENGNFHPSHLLQVVL